MPLSRKRRQADHAEKHDGHDTAIAALAGDIKALHDRIDTLNTRLGRFEDESGTRHRDVQKDLATLREAVSKIPAPSSPPVAAESTEPPPNGTAENPVAAKATARKRTVRTEQGEPGTP